MTDRAAGQWFDLAFASSRTGMLLLDAGSTVRLANAAAVKIFGWHEHELLGCPVDVLASPSTKRKLDKVRQRFARPGQRRPRRTTVELRGVRRDGCEFDAAVEVGLIDSGAETSVLVAVTDLTRRGGIEARYRRQNDALRDAVGRRTEELEAANARLQAEVEERRRTERELLLAQRRLQELNEKLRRLAMVDELTGLANRRHFDSRFRVEYQRALRAKTPLSVVMLDLDDFKTFNDQAGHRAGDDCLRRVARAVGGCLRRPADLVARWGGEELAAILPETPREGAIQIARAMRQAVRALAIPHPVAPTGIVTVSAGVAAFSGPALPKPHALLEAADRALYAAKERGRDRVCVAAPASRDRLPAGEARADA